MSKSLRQRNPRQKDSAHLAFVRAQPCCVCRSNQHIEAAHIRMACPLRGKEPTGMQEKPDDKWTTPLCAYHHRTGITAQHKMGEEDFWIMVGRDPFGIALSLWTESGGEQRSQSTAPTKKQRKIDPRKAPEHRRKIQSGRKIQSNPVIKSRGFDKSPKKNEKHVTFHSDEIAERPLQSPLHDPERSVA